MIYLDHNATTPLSAVARCAYHAALDLPANPSSIHRPGRQARRLLDQSRESLAAAIGAIPEEVIFTASGSEANNLALKGVVFSRRPEAMHLIVSAIEHDSILRTARWLAGNLPSVSLTEMAPDSTGRIRPEDIFAALRPETRLVALGLANHETGMIQPAGELTPLLIKRGVLLHIDAVQALGRIPVDVRALDCDLLSLAAHKFHGPKGVGLLYVRRGTPLAPLVQGGNQEHGLRAGTENLPGIAGMAAAAVEATATIESTRRHLTELEQIFWGELQAHGLSPQLNSAWDDKLPGTLNLAFAGLSSEDVVVGLDIAGVAVSAGSACASGVMEASPVLTAMRLPPWQIEGGVRISFGRENTPDEARRAAFELVKLARRVHQSTPSEVLN